MSLDSYMLQSKAPTFKLEEIAWENQVGNQKSSAVGRWNKARQESKLKTVKTVDKVQKRGSSSESATPSDKPDESERQHSPSATPDTS